MVDHEERYEPPQVEDISTDGEPSVTSAGGTPVYGAITLIEADGEKRMEERGSGSAAPSERQGA